MTSEKLTIVAVSHAGIRQVNRAVFRELVKLNVRVFLVVPEKIILKSGKELKAEPVAEGEPPVFPMELTGNNPRMYYYPALRTWLDKTKPDVILLENDPVSRLGMQLANWCSKNNCTILCQTYENLPRDPRSTLKNQGLKRLPVNLALYAINIFNRHRFHGILVVNEDSELIFRSYGYQRVVRIPLGYDSNIFYADAESRRIYRKKLSIPDQALLIGYFGRLIREKGVHLLVKALESLKSLNWYLLLDHMHDQEDKYSSEIEAMIREYGIENRVKYFEADHFEIANYMRATDIMVAPSLTTQSFKEQYGRTVQEAMACGCAAVVSDSGNLKDLVGNKAVVFEEGNSNALSLLLKNIMNDQSLRNKLRQELQNRAEEKLTAQHQARLILGAVHSVMEENAGLK